MGLLEKVKNQIEGSKQRFVEDLLNAIASQDELGKTEVIVDRHPENEEAIVFVMRGVDDQGEKREVMIALECGKIYTAADILIGFMRKRAELDKKREVNSAEKNGEEKTATASEK